MIPDIPGQLREARRELMTIPEFEIIDDLAWHPAAQKWTLHFRLSCNGYAPTEDVPQLTEWYAVISPSYPLGKIEICPAMEGGITATFQHQALNRPNKHLPWRKGVICVNTSTNHWGRIEIREQPYEPLLRLKWQVQRSVDWLKAAAEGKLAPPGEPFELPEVPLVAKMLVAFNEDDQTFAFWRQAAASEGMLSYVGIGGAPQLFAVERLKCGQDTLPYEWGKHISDASRPGGDGLWALLPSVPVLHPWETPTRWGQLFEILSDQGIDLKKRLLAIVNKNIHRPIKLVGLGFPIADTIAGPDTKIHWLFAELPEVPVPTSLRRPADRIDHKAKVWFADQAPIRWTIAENWNKEEICARGRLVPELEKGRILLVGTGALGSLFADLLIRLSCERLTVVDAQVSVVGNLSRHILTLDAVRKDKAEAVANRLNQTFPFCQVDYYIEDIDNLINSGKIPINNFDIIIDATGSDDVMYSLGAYLANSGKTFISLSTGLRAKRLYCFISHASEGNNIAEMFKEMTQPWLQKDRDENQGMQLPRDGIGCWHPVFPARLDDIAMLLHAIVKPIEITIKEQVDNTLVIAEQAITDNGKPSGILIKYEPR